jgi:hypothetical protein
MFTRNGTVVCALKPFSVCAIVLPLYGPWGKAWHVAMAAAITAKLRAECIFLSCLQPDCSARSYNFLAFFCCGGVIYSKAQENPRA